MNERIKLLAEQAGMYIVDDEFSTYGKFAEKFALLIVRECIEWCNAHATINGTAQQVRDSIKEHFGVE